MSLAASHGAGLRVDRLDRLGDRLSIRVRSCVLEVKLYEAMTDDYNLTIQEHPGYVTLFETKSVQSQTRFAELSDTGESPDICG